MEQSLFKEQRRICTGRMHQGSSARRKKGSSAAAAGGSCEPPAAKVLVHEEDMYQYVNFRVLDSIGYPGAYRKFMLKRKEQGAEWAVKMNEHVVGVQHALKELSLLEQDIKKSSILKNLDVIWQHVIESNTPPSDLHLTIGTCLITGKPNVPCIVIRGKGRGAHNFTVCSKFAPFLYHLWIIYKIDILIKVALLVIAPSIYIERAAQVYTRRVLEEVDPDSALSLADIARKIKDKDLEVRNLARSLHAAYTHVFRSAKGGLLAVV